MEGISWGIIGCGNVTEVKSGPAFNKVAGSRLTAVMRRDGQKAREYASRHDVPKWYDDAMTLINDPDVNAIYIATPPSSHEYYALAALEAGKPVYLEKPMSTDSASAKRIAKKAADASVKLCVAHYRRELAIFKKIKNLLDEHYIGDIRFIDLRLFQEADMKTAKAADDNWRTDPAVSGGGYFHDLAPHQLDLMYHFFGTPVSASGLSLNQAGNYAADDLVTGTIQFAGGVIMNGLWCFAVAEGSAIDRIDIVGSDGSISFSCFTMKELKVIKNGKEEMHYYEQEAHVQQPMIEKVVEYFSGQGNNPCTGDEGVVVMQMIDAFTRQNTFV